MSHHRFLISSLLSALFAIGLAACARTAVSPTVTPPVIIPTPTVTAAPTATVLPPATATVAPEAPSGAGVNTARSDPALEAAVDRYLATAYEGTPFSGAILMAKGDALLLAKGYGQANRNGDVANTPSTRYRLGSLTKPFTAVAILMLHHAGKLDIAAPVCQYLSACPPAWAEITVAQILAHTAGIPDLTRFPDFEATKATPATPDELLARFSDKPLDFPPGSRWQYSNSGYIVLGAVIERVSGQPYEAYLQEHIFAPLGMQATGYDHNLDTLATGYTPRGEPAAFIHMSIPYAAGGLYSTVEDLYRFDRALYTDQLLPQTLRDAMFTQQASLGAEGPDVGYGYGWIVRTGPQGKIVEHNGNIEGFSAGMRRYVDQDAVIIVLSNEEGRRIAAVIDGLAALLFEEGG